MGEKFDKKYKLGLATIISSILILAGSGAVQSQDDNTSRNIGSGGNTVPAALIVNQIIRNFSVDMEPRPNIPPRFNFDMLNIQTSYHLPINRSVYDQLEIDTSDIESSFLWPLMFDYEYNELNVDLDLLTGIINALDVYNSTAKENQNLLDRIDLILQQKAEEMTNSLNYQKNKDLLLFLIVNMQDWNSNPDRFEFYNHISALFGFTNDDMDSIISYSLIVGGLLDSSKISNQDDNLIDLPSEQRADHTAHILECPGFSEQARDLILASGLKVHLISRDLYIETGKARYGGFYRNGNVYLPILIDEHKGYHVFSMRVLFHEVLHHLLQTFVDTDELYGSIYDLLVTHGDKTTVLTEWEHLIIEQVYKNTRLVRSSFNFSTDHGYDFSHLAPKEVETYSKWINRVKIPYYDSNGYMQGRPIEEVIAVVLEDILFESIHGMPDIFQVSLIEN